ncbi:hypothetical protein VNO77_19932 [Canavalia gladiata]|uniref:Uncharacterized protein n=1 Tax=Canavalia gladiata TaxID=3824 RepID=A0AAN9QIX7_CANGL
MFSLTGGVIEFDFIFMGFENEMLGLKGEGFKLRLDWDFGKFKGVSGILGSSGARLEFWEVQGFKWNFEEVQGLGWNFEKFDGGWLTRFTGLGESWGRLGRLGGSSGLGEARVFKREICLQGVSNPHPVSYDPGPLTTKLSSWLSCGRFELSLSHILMDANQCSARQLHGLPSLILAIHPCSFCDISRSKGALGLRRVCAAWSPSLAEPKVCSPGALGSDILPCQQQIESDTHRLHLPQT